MSKALANAHDHFFKDLFSRPALIRSFVQSYLDPAIAAEIDLDTLEIDKDTFVDPELREHFSDLVCKARLSHGRPCVLYLLFDHKSSPDAMVPLQLARYVVRLWEKHVKDAKETPAEKRDSEAREDTTSPLPLPLIIPVVVYHGQERWRVPTDLSELISTPPRLARYRPHLCYSLVDLSRYTDAQITGVSLLCAGLLIMKHIWSKDLPERLPGIFDLLRDIGESLDGLWALQAVIRYLAAAAPHLETSQLSAILRQKFPDVGGQAMPTIAEQWIQEGEKKGEKKGREEGEKIGEKKGVRKGEKKGVRKGEKKAKLETACRLLERGMSPDEVATLVDLPLSAVQALTH